MRTSTTNSRSPWRAGLAPGVLALVACTACAPPAPLPPDPGVTFQAHEVHEGLMIDAKRNGGPTLAAPAQWLQIGSAPTFVMASGAGERDGVWLVGPAEAVVRRGTSPDAPTIGSVQPTWDDNAVRLRIASANGPTYVTGRFHREDAGSGLSVLSRNMTLSVDVEGVYRAEVRTLDGTPTGWLRLRVGLHEPSPMMVEGALPPAIDDGLATATAVALRDEVDRIQRETIGARRKSWM